MRALACRFWRSQHARRGMQFRPATAPPAALAVPMRLIVTVFLLCSRKRQPRKEAMSPIMAAAPSTARSAAKARRHQWRKSALTRDKKVAPGRRVAGASGRVRGIEKCRPASSSASRQRSMPSAKRYRVSVALVATASSWLKSICLAASRRRRRRRYDGDKHHASHVCSAAWQASPASCAPAPRYAVARWRRRASCCPRAPAIWRGRWPK